SSARTASGSGGLLSTEFRERAPLRAQRAAIGGDQDRHGISPVHARLSLRGVPLGGAGPCRRSSDTLGRWVFALMLLLQWLVMRAAAGALRRGSVLVVLAVALGSPGRIARHSVDDTRRLLVQIGEQLLCIAIADPQNRHAHTGEFFCHREYNRIVVGEHLLGVPD